MNLYADAFEKIRRALPQTLPQTLDELAPPAHREGREEGGKA